MTRALARALTTSSAAERKLNKVYELALPDMAHSASHHSVFIGHAGSAELRCNISITSLSSGA